MQVKLVSADGQEFEIPADVALQSGAIRSFMEERPREIRLD